MSKRSKKTRDEHGKWELGGGGVKFGEEIESALTREIYEEYSTDVLEHEFLGYRNILRQHQGKPTHWIALDFAVRVDLEKVKIGEPDMIDELRWATFDTLPDDLHSQFPKFIELYRKRLEGSFLNKE